MVRHSLVPLALYVAVIFLTLPFLPDLVTFATTRFGTEKTFLLLYSTLAAIGLLPSLRLVLAPRPAGPAPALAYLGLLLFALFLALTLASSPVGRVHLAEYGLLGVLFHLAFSGMKAKPAARYAGAVAGASLVGLLDELVQHALPNRVFDWYDVALNVGAVALGVMAAAWWHWTGRLRRESSQGGSGPHRGS